MKTYYLGIREDNGPITEEQLISGKPPTALFLYGFACLLQEFNTVVRASKFKWDLAFAEYADAVYKNKTAGNRWTSSLPSQQKNIDWELLLEQTPRYWLEQQALFPFCSYEAEERDYSDGCDLVKHKDNTMRVRMFEFPDEQIAYIRLQAQDQLNQAAHTNSTKESEDEAKRYQTFLMLKQQYEPEIK